MRPDAFGNYWPDADKFCGPGTIESLPNIERWLFHVKRRGVCIQAGGNCGLYPRELAKHFESVYTFEPDPENFECMMRNCDPSISISMLPYALGDKPGRVSINRERPENCGAHYVVPGDEVHVTTIDLLDVPADLIALDVEGYEYKALLGALNTLYRHMPVVIFESKWAKRYGKERPAELLKSLGYHFAERIGLDEVWKPHS